MTYISKYFTTLAIIYFLSAFFTVLIVKKTVEENEKKEGENLLLRACANIAPWVPFFNTFMCLVFIVASWEWCIANVHLFLMKIKMKLSSKSSKFRIGRIILTKFYE